MTKKINLTSENIKADRIDLLKQLFPETVAENQIDWDKLRKTFGEDLDINGEKFNFTWAGKSKAIKAVIEPSKATLKPSKEEGVKFDESENLFIEGDNLEVLKLLQKAYFEKVKMIYIDPPYNTGGDFVYKDDFKSPIENYLKQTGQKNGESEKLTTNTETNGRFHSDWLNMMYPRLKLAWNLLKDDGLIFISIDDNEEHHLRQVMDETFGDQNFVTNVIWQKKYTQSNDAKFFSNTHDYIMIYAKDIHKCKIQLLPRTKEMDARYKNPDNDPKGDWKAIPLHSKSGSTSSEVIFNNGVKWTPPKGTFNRYSQGTIKKSEELGKIYFGKNGKGTPVMKKYLSEVGGVIPKTIWLYDEVGSNDDARKNIKIIFEGNPFDTPKPVTLIQRMLRLSTNINSSDIVLDFFAGSGTTAQAVLELNKEDGGNRKFILIQLPEPTSKESEANKSGYKTIAEITKERIRRVIKGYGDNPQPIDDGFKVFKLDKSNYPENNFEYDPERSEAENQEAFKTYLDKAGQMRLLESADDLDIVYENIVKEGMSLNSKITKIPIGSNTFSVVIDGERTLYICLEGSINPETIKVLTSPEYKNRVLICLDTAVDDSAKANLSLNLDLKTI